MKKNTINGMLLAGLLLAFTGSFAQSAKQREQLKKHSDVVKLKELSARFKSENGAKYEEALKLAKLNGWPVIIEENGGFAALQEISADGKPLYLSTYNVGSAKTSRANEIQPGGSTGLNLTGAGMYVGIWDGGYPLGTHQDLVGRTFPSDGSGSLSNIGAHPTHVAGTVLGSGVGDSRARGIAYEAAAAVNTFANNADLEQMAIQAEGLVVSNHSYGYRASNIDPNMLGAYIDQSRGLDELLFSAPYYQPVFAAGNDNGGSGRYDLLSGKQTSKNAIVVAAVSEVDSYTGPSSVSIASFSSWGPTDDNRIKPDISSKGVAVYSTGNLNNSYYYSENGTSMAAPGVTGVITLLQQHYSNLHPGDLPYMKSATVRGLVAHTADEAGAADGPDPIYGWGLMNAQKAAELITNDGTSAAIQENILMPGQTYTVMVASNGNEPLIATLSWTDPAGTVAAGTSPRLVNDLDIRVTQGNNVSYPWRLANSNSGAAVKGDNVRDNIEKIEVPEASGNYVITITHKGTTLRNPATGGTPQQAYSLLVSGISSLTNAVADKQKSAFEVYPNPAHGQLNISLVELSENANVEIIDMQGRSVMQKNIDTVNTSIDVNNLTAGVYFVKLSVSGRSETKKVIIK